MFLWKLLLDVAHLVQPTAMATIDCWTGSYPSLHRPTICINPNIQPLLGNLGPRFVGRSPQAARAVGNKELRLAQSAAREIGFFGKLGELASNEREDNELSMLALHLLQNCMVYINTLMLQQVLGQAHWRERLTAVDRRALTLLIWGHVNPYGRYVLDIATRLPLSA